MAAYSIGLNPISWLLVGELFPLEFRGTGTSLATGFSYICAFVGVKTFVDLRESIGMDGTFWTYAVISLFGLVFSLLAVPETRGRMLDEMKPKVHDDCHSQDCDGDSTNTSTSDLPNVWAIHFMQHLIP